MNSTNPQSIIGFFDSGIGGISVWREVVSRLPHHASLYFADSFHCPYGRRPPAQVLDFSRAISRFLIQRGAGLIVVACNTASAAALHTLRREFPVPFVGMEPAVKPAAKQTSTGHVGVLATAGTVNGELFRTTSARHADGVTVHLAIGDGLVEAVEDGRIEAPETEALLRHYIDPLVRAGVDQIALGCTHYPLLLPVLRRIVPDNVNVIDPAAAVARQVTRLVYQTNANATGSQGAPAAPQRQKHRFFSSGDTQRLAELLESLTGQTYPVEKVVWLDGTSLVLEVTE